MILEQNPITLMITNCKTVLKTNDVFHNENKIKI